MEQHQARFSLTHFLLPADRMNDGLHRRVGFSPAAGHRQPPSLTTGQKAVAYKPDIRIRMTALRDYISIFRSRYMDSLFGLACAVLAYQLAAVLFRGLQVVEPELLQLPNNTVLAAENYARVAGRAVRDASRAAGDLRVLDACRLAYDELGWLWLPVLLVGLAYVLRRKSTVYLLDFTLFEPPEEWKVSQEELISLVRRIGHAKCSFNEEDLAFMEKVLSNSGTGDKTAWPPGIVRCLDPALSQDESLACARHEAETIVCGALESLFRSTSIQPKEVDFLIINCSLFSPTPSLCAMASNRFRFRSNCRTFNLSGQGCSASLLSVDLAAELLQNNPNSIAVVVSTELITQSLYHGHERSMLLQNTLFRCGGAAIALTNKKRLIGRAKYRLRHLVRTQITDDESYSAVFQCEDETGLAGVRLSKSIVQVAGNAMKVNLTQLGPLILPLSEQLRVVWSIVNRSPKRYVPNFKSAIDHFCIHAGGRAVLDGIEKNLKLESKDMLPSRTVLYERGNTSSSSIWYELRYIEEHARLRRGQKVMQLAFGSGFKCNSAVWSCCK